MTDKKPTFMRADKELLTLLKSKKAYKKESYAEVIKRMIQKEVKC